MSPSPLATSSEEQRLRTSFTRLHHIAAELLATADTHMHTTEQRYREAERDCARQQHRATQQVDAQTGEALDDVCAVLIGRAERLAPGLAAAPWSDSRWRSGEWLGCDGAGYLRWGSIDVSGLAIPAELPALLPLLDAGNVTLCCDNADHDTPNSWSGSVLHTLVLRALATVGVGGLEVSVFDPALTGALSPFGRLRVGATGALGTSLFAEPLTSTEQLLEWLQGARTAALRVAELSGQHGVANLGQLTEVLGRQPEPYRLLVALNYPYGIDTRVQAELKRLVHAGPARGISFLFVTDPAALAASEIDCAPVLQQTMQLRAVEGGVCMEGVTTSADVVVRPDPAPQRDLIQWVADQLARAATARAAPSVELDRVLPRSDERWSQDATDGVSAPIGLAGTDIVELSLRSADPALPNLLVGGASGQGKSNLLLVLLHSIAARYSPEQVEMYLLDFKDGLEFDRLGPGADRPYWMPHARVLGLEGDRSFGLAVLRHLEVEFAHRAEQFRARGVASLAALRRRYPDQVVPRILLVIDEFQVMVAQGDEIGREAIDIIETLARRGRAVGIHLILASQTLSGIDTLASKERSIFGQFPWRISLKTEASESEAVLGRGNTEAAQLRYRGEVILNSDYGAPARNQRAVVAYADEIQLDQLRQQLWQASGAVVPPRVFYARRPSKPGQLMRLLIDDHGWQDGGHSGSQSDGRAILGLPISVSSEPVTFELRGDPGCAVALLGDGRDDALGVLSSAALALSVSAKATDADRPAARYVLLDGAGGVSGAEHNAELARLARALRGRGHDVEVVPAAGIGQRLIELGQQLQARLPDSDSPTQIADDEPVSYIIGAGLHRASRLTSPTMAGAVPAHVLAQLVREGPLARMYLLGWWNSARIFTEQLGYEAAPLLAGLVFLRAPEADVQALCGPYLRFTPQPHRALFVDRGSGASPIELVPFGPLMSGQAEQVAAGVRR